MINSRAASVYFVVRPNNVALIKIYLHISIKRKKQEEQNGAKVNEIAK
jgi:hypothetical protein